MAVIISLIGGVTNNGDSVSAGSASILAAISVEGDADEGQTIDTHTYGSTSFTNTTLVETAVGTNAIYAHLGWIESPASGPETYTSELSNLSPSIGHSTLLLGIEGADGSDLIDDDQTEHIVQNGVSVFPTHTFSMVSGQACVIVVQANKTGSITPPADNGNDTWIELIEPWHIGGSFKDGAAFKLEATETHTNATAQPGDTINSFITSSHMYVFNEDAGGGGPTTTPKVTTYTALGTSSLSTITTFLMQPNITATGTPGLVKTISKILGMVASGSSSIQKTIGKLVNVTATGTATQQEGLITTQSISTNATGTLITATSLIIGIGGTIKRISRYIVRNIVRNITRLIGAK